VLGEEHVGRQVSVDGYDMPGTLRYYGPHATKPGMRCGVELSQPVGLNNGTIKVCVHGAAYRHVCLADQDV
jgi:dynactin complex subunit